MGKLATGLFSTERCDWETPSRFFQALDEEFDFEIDVAATDSNAKCGNYYTKAQDGLLQDWAGKRCFCNPPYGTEISAWVKKAYDESQRGALVVMLIPARTDTRYWHDYIFNKAEIRFIKGRLRFGMAGRQTGVAPFPSAVVIFGSKKKTSSTMKKGR
jgi:site-specific DNA-methyltransferase (adenine-specific)